MKNKNKKSLLIVCFILFSIFIIGGITIFNKLSSKQEVIAVKKNHKTVIGADLEDWMFGEWEFTTNFSSNSANVEVDTDNLYMKLNTTEGEIDENDITLSFSGELKDGTSQVDFNVHELEMILPLYLFYNVQEYYYAEFDEANSRLIHYNDAGDAVGYVSIGSDLPYCDIFADPEGCASIPSKFVWTYDDYEGLLIFNNEEIKASTGGNNYNFNFELVYSFLPSEIIPNEEFQVSPIILFSSEIAFLDEWTTILSVGDDEIFSLDGVNSLEEKEYDEWQAVWGASTGDYDFYVEYPVLGTIDYSKDYDVEYSYVSDDGDIVAYSRDGNTYSKTSNVCNVSGNGLSSLNCFIVVGYNASGALSKEVNFSETINGYTTDSEDSVTFEWNHYYENKNLGSEVNYPVGVNKEINSNLNSLNAGVGALNKITNGTSVNFDWLIEATSSPINKTSSGNVKAFNLWNLTNLGTSSYTVSIGSNGGVLDTLYNGMGDCFDLSDNYKIKSFSVKDDAEYDYVLSNDEYILNLETDTNLYGNKDVYIKIDNGSYELIGSYKKDVTGNIVYTANDDRTVSNNNVTASNPVILPSNVTDIKVSYTGNKAAIYIGINVQAELSSSDTLISKINSMDESSIILKNKSMVDVNSEVDEIETGTYLTKFNVKSYASSSSILNNKVGDEESVTYTDSVYEQINYDISSKNFASKLLNEQKSGKAYLLLPMGATLDGSVIVKAYGTNTNVEANVSSTLNYNGTGRTLLTIDISNGTLANNLIVADTYAQTGYTINYKIKYGVKANQLYGNVLNKDMAYVSNISLGEGYKQASDASSILFSDNDTQKIFDNLLGLNKNKVYLFSTDSIEVPKVTVTAGDYTKEVKNELTDIYFSDISVVEGSEYKYRLQYLFNSDYDEITNLVFLDKIEGNYGSNDYFKGYLNDVDTSYLNGKGVKTTIYYSTNVTNFDNLNLSDSSVWSTTKPSDVTKIVGVAVSCSDYVFKGIDKIVPMVDINMVAANDFDTSIEKKAYNDSVIQYNNVGNSEVKTLRSKTTSVKLEKATLNLTTTSSLGTGTADNPVIVEGDYSYEVKLANSSTLYDYENLSFTMIMPKCLEVIDLQEKSNLVDGIKGTYVFDKETGIFKYTMSKLDKSEIKDISIKVKINLNELDKGKAFNVKVKLDKLENYNYNGNEINLYNKLEIPELTFNKYAMTDDTGDFRDEAMLIIGKGETYSYRVRVNNVSVVNAKNIQVVDYVPSGLTVVTDSITNNGVYDSTKNTITWVVDSLSKNNSINLDYNVSVAADIPLGTVYKSSAHIKLKNPIDESLLLYDDDTNIIGTLYQIISDIKVTNNVLGNLADKTKAFNYEFNFNGDIRYAGSYDILDSKGKVIDKLVINNEGVGSYSTSLIGGEFITFKLLPGRINYSIIQDVYEGYEASASSAFEKIDNTIKINGVTDENRLVTYKFNNKYAASTTASVSASVTYDKQLTDGMFKLELTDNKGYSDQKEIDLDGNVNFDVLNFVDEIGLFSYTVKQIDTGIKKVGYDTNSYNVVINVTNDGKGNLSKTIKYYNKLNEEVNEMVFENKYVPNGLIINNVNTSDYIDSSKVFKYTLSVNGVAGSYKITGNDNKEIGELVIDDTGIGTYDFELKSDEKITILDLPNGTTYEIKQELIPYYTGMVDGYTYTIDQENNMIIHSGVVLDDTIQLRFKNNYKTSFEFEPKVKVNLVDKTLEDQEFTFMIKDVSTGVTNGYVNYMKNDIDGNIDFDFIKYNRPGTYVYEITQVKGESNHIYYDLSKCLLSIVLVDNGDGTMTLESSIYNFLSNGDAFVNKYSKDPIVPEDDKNNNTGGNPNTSDRMVLIMVLVVFVIGLFIVEGRVKRRRFELKI